MIEPGNKNAVSLGSDLHNINELIKAHLKIATAHSSLVALYSTQFPTESLASLPSYGSDEYAKSTGITISGVSQQNEGDTEKNNFITGTVTVGKVILAGFAFMIASNIKLKILKSASGGTSFDFTYNGEATVDKILAAFGKNQTIDFSNDGN
ncbi:hypothetical protein ABRQ07_18315 [Pectobacterium polonicum]|uniref:Uncharacterized protein n=1 Tax=Pectobacterium polonicum TaxID=2485124 RepID=A0ABV1PEQ6_9GAMM|nr:hypothetical protein [Pectobacterium polonicum]MDC9820764.1 hypothetical protein [Pectobacterium polonicum]